MADKMYPTKDLTQTFELKEDKGTENLLNRVENVISKTEDFIKKIKPSEENEICETKYIDKHDLSEEENALAENRQALFNELAKPLVDSSLLEKLIDVLTKAKNDYQSAYRKEQGLGFTSDNSHQERQSQEKKLTQALSRAEEKITMLSNLYSYKDEIKAICDDGDRSSSYYNELNWFFYQCKTHLDYWLKVDDKKYFEAKEMFCCQYGQLVEEIEKPNLSRETSTVISMCKEIEKDIKDITEGSEACQAILGLQKFQKERMQFKKLPSVSSAWNDVIQEIIDEDKSTAREYCKQLIEDLQSHADKCVKALQLLSPMADKIDDLISKRVPLIQYRQIMLRLSPCLQLPEGEWLEDLAGQLKQPDLRKVLKNLDTFLQELNKAQDGLSSLRQDAPLEEAIPFFSSIVNTNRRPKRQSLFLSFDRERELSVGTPIGIRRKCLMKLKNFSLTTNTNKSIKYTIKNSTG